MKKAIGSIFLAFILFLPFGLTGQAIAGYVQPGTSIYYSPIELVIIENDQDTTTYLDLDNDGTHDIRIWLIKGNTPSDAPNMAILFSIGSTFSFCNNPELPESIALHSLGDTLCANGLGWGTDSIYTAGCYGGWNCTQDGSPVSDKYIAYRNNSTGEVGWLRVSMSLYAQVDQLPVSFTIYEFLHFDQQSGVDENSIPNHPQIIPNPTVDGNFSIQNNTEIKRIDIFDASGQHIFSYLSPNLQLRLPIERGLYIIRIRDSKGQNNIQRIIRL